MGYTNRKTQYSLSLEITPGYFKPLSIFPTRKEAEDRKKELIKEGKDGNYSIMPIKRWE